MAPCWRATIGWSCCASAASTSTGFLERSFTGRMESERIMRTRVFWVAGMRKGRLGILPRPRGGDWLADETAAWREAGVEMVVSLLEPEEAAQLVLEAEAAAAASSGIAVRGFSIPGRGVAPSRGNVAGTDHRRPDAIHTR